MGEKTWRTTKLASKRNQWLDQVNNWLYNLAGFVDRYHLAEQRITIYLERHLVGFLHQPLLSTADHAQQFPLATFVAPPLPSGDVPSIAQYHKDGGHSVVYSSRRRYWWLPRTQGKCARVASRFMFQLCHGLSRFLVTKGDRVYSSYPYSSSCPSA